jgi:hypothetical protein
MYESIQFTDKYKSYFKVIQKDHNYQNSNDQF